MEIKVKTFSTKTKGIMDENENWYNMEDLLDPASRTLIEKTMNELTRGSVVELDIGPDGFYRGIKIIKKAEKTNTFKKEMDDYIGFEALLSEVHKHKDISIQTEMLRDNEGKSLLTNGYVFKATITIGKSIFTGHGDADNTNTTNTTKDAMIRFAETRAIARACRMAIGIGMTAKEELSGGSV